MNLDNTNEVLLILQVIPHSSQLILQPFFRFSYVTGSSITSPGQPPIWIRIGEEIMKTLKCTTCLVTISFESYFGWSLECQYVNTKMIRRTRHLSESFWTCHNFSSHTCDFEGKEIKGANRRCPRHTFLYCGPRDILSLPKLTVASPVMARLEKGNKVPGDYDRGFTILANRARNVKRVKYFPRIFPWLANSKASILYQGS